MSLHPPADRRALLVAHLTTHVGDVVARLPAPTELLPGLELLVLAPRAADATDGDGADDARYVATLGVSDHAMATPPGAPVPARAELLLRIAPGPLAPRPDAPLAEQPWPLRWLVAAAQVPRAGATFLGAYHTLPAPAPPLAGFLVVPPTALADGDDRLATPDGEVAIYGLLGLHPGELAAAQRDAPALVAALIAAGLDDTLDEARPAVA